jgi:hypothetical protein
MNTLYKLAAILAVFSLAMMACSDGSLEVVKKDSLDLNYEQDPGMMIPLDVSVDDATDDWWFHDNITFVGRISGKGNIILVAEIDRCLGDDGDDKVTKTFDCRFYDGNKWTKLSGYTERDVIKEMKTISTNPQMQFHWIEPYEAGTLWLLTTDGRVVVIDFQGMKPYYSLTNDIDFKRTYSSGLGMLQVGDSIWQGQAFHEMINARGNNRCTDEMPDFDPGNSFRVFGQTSGGKTLIASVDTRNPSDVTHNSFFTICNIEKCRMAEGEVGITNANSDFRNVDGYEGYTPHFIDIYSGDSINVRLHLWTDKDEYDVLGDGWSRTGFFGNAIFWNRREKIWGVLDHYQPAVIDTTELMGSTK